MSLGSNLKKNLNNIGHNDATRLQQLLFQEFENYGVMWMVHLLASSKQLGMTHNKSQELYLNTLRLMRYCFSHFLWKPIRAPNIPASEFKRATEPFFFPIHLKIIVYDSGDTELIVWTGPKDREIHAFHRLLNTTYTSIYNLAIERVESIITRAHNERKRFQRPNSPRQRNTPNNARNTPNNARNDHAKRLMEMIDALGHKGMYVFPDSGPDSGSGSKPEKTTLLCKAGCIVSW